MLLNFLLVISGLIFKLDIRSNVDMMTMLFRGRYVINVMLNVFLCMHVCMNVAKASSPMSTHEKAIGVMIKLSRKIEILVNAKLSKVEIKMRTN